MSNLLSESTASQVLLGEGVEIHLGMEPFFEVPIDSFAGLRIARSVKQSAETAIKLPRIELKIQTSGNLGNVT